MITEALARFVIETKTDDVPDDVIGCAQNALVDVLGVALAGVLEPTAAIARRWVEELAARPQATCWGQKLRTSAADAAFANGICSHALDFDDSHPSLRGHPSTTIVPAALACGEVAKASGKDVLAACAIGVEIACKLGRAFGQGHIMHGWHMTATVGALSSAAVAARLWQLDVEGLRRAWGIAGSQMSGLMRNFGTMTKPFHAGNAARSGVLATWMARSGFTADETIFDGKGGVLDVYSGDDGEQLAGLIPRLGKSWEIHDPGIFVKGWPCCYSNHRAVGGLFELIEQHAITPEEVTEIAIGFLPGSDASLISHNPRTGLEGKFSVEYCAAATLIDRRLTLQTFTDAMLERPQVRQLMRKVKRYAIPSDKLFSGISGYTDVSVVTPRGRFETRVDRVPGSREWPLTEQVRKDKFMDCATRVLSAPEAEHLLDLCRKCRALADVTKLAHATVPSAGEKSR